MRIERGYRGNLNDELSVDSPIIVRITTVGGAVYDTCCFGVDAANKLSDDRYMIFYNQPASPANEISYSANGNTGEYTVNLTRLPSSVAKLVFTVSIDGSGTMRQIQSFRAELIQNNRTAFELMLSGQDFHDEKAIIGIELYRKSVWRISAVAQGFNGGLAELLKSYGGELSQEQTAPPPAPAPVTNPAPPPPAKPAEAVDPEKKLAERLMKKIDLSKDKINLEKHVVNLSKCVVDLSKKSGVDLGGTSAKVVVALDYSGSMSSLYNNGTVQNTINRLVPLGLTFDDNGSIDMFLFQSDFRKMDDLNLSNYENYVTHVIKNSGYSMGGTNYAPVLRAIIEGNSVSLGLFRGSLYVQPIVDDGDPTFVLFITDGENADRSDTDSVIRKCSDKNVFIQFIGIGNSSFSYLEKLDDMEGRTRDNTGFTRMSDLNGADDKELYTNVLEQFSGWLKGLQ